MIKILLIDDEVMIRTGIRTSIEWESYGMTITGEASNGEEGLEKALELDPDIIILDVKMPVMDGLKFTKILKEKKPDIRIVIISGYNEFKYAKEALHLGVNEYLLKPIGAEELISILQKQCEELEKKRAAVNKERVLKHIVEDNLFLVQSRFISSIIQKEYIEEASIFEKAKELQMDFSGMNYQVIVIDIDDFYLITENLSDREKNQLKLSIKNIAEEVLKPLTNSSVHLSEFDYLISVINIKNLKDSQIFGLYQEIKECVKKYQNLTVTIGVSNTFTGISQVPVGYNEAVLALRSKVFKGKDRIIDINKLDKAQKAAPIIYPSADEKEIINYLRIMEIDKLNSVIEKICSDLKQMEIEDKKIKEICLRLIAISTSYLDEIGVDYRSYGEKDFNPYKEIEKYETLFDIEVWLKATFKNFIEVMQSSKNEKFKGIVKIAIQYINENYQEDIDVLRMAAVTYVTPNYFSRVFKKETGKSFTEWLNMVRIDKAKQFLKDPKWKVYEIAEKVGYKDYKSFTFNFKKYSACTPKAYQESNMT